MRTSGLLAAAKAPARLATPLGAFDSDHLVAVRPSTERLEAGDVFLGDGEIAVRRAQRDADHPPRRRPSCLERGNHCPRVQPVRLSEIEPELRMIRLALAGLGSRLARAGLGSAFWTLGRKFLWAASLAFRAGIAPR